MNAFDHECRDLTSLLGQAGSKPGKGTAQPPGNSEPLSVIHLIQHSTIFYNINFRIQMQIFFIPSSTSEPVMVRHLCLTPRSKSIFNNFLIINSNNNFNYLIEAETTLLINFPWLEKNQLTISTPNFPFVSYFSRLNSDFSQIISTVFHFPFYTSNHSYLPIEKVNREEHHHTTFNYLKETPSSPKNENEYFSQLKKVNTLKETIAL
jgi:hypothetical protein